MKNNKVIEFYLAVQKLKNEIRTGWQELKIRDRLESVAEHVFGELVLAIALDSECDLNVDMNKVFKMIVLKELKKVDLKEITTSRDHSNDKDLTYETMARITNGLVKQDELMQLVDEAKKCETKEAKLVFQISKLESDLQAKVYDLEGRFDLDVALEDAKYFGEELSNEIIPQMKNASDGFILYDRKYYEDPIFKELSEEIQNLESTEIE